jgi:lipoate-protein ligase A
VNAWTLVEAGTLTGAGNMALDLGLLGASIAGERREPVVRVYGWDPPALSVGAKVDLPEDVRQRCAAVGVDVVHRATGGGCVLHDRDVTYCVVAPEAGRSVLEAYRWVAAGLMAGLRLLGIESAVAEHPATRRPLDCFAVATGADLEVGGRKICGSAQVRRRGWFLQHGSLPIVDVRRKTASVLGDSVDRTSTCLQESRPGTTWHEAASALIAGFAAAWGAEPRRRPPERFEWGVTGEVPQYRGVPEGPGAAAILQDPRRMV